ncbi:MAG: cyclic pyranopterin monophosphate synthase MoaC [candidate division Zixibacteria bacterium]
MTKLSHIDADGKAKMVDVGGKETTRRSATATVSVLLNHDTYKIVRDSKGPKGDVLTVAKLAAIQAAKKTSELIPLCHQIALEQVEVNFALNDESAMIIIESTAKCSAQTGVEMEALTACSVAALTVYDMLKAVQKDICITDLKLLKKSGGKSGDFKNTNL